MATTELQAWSPCPPRELDTLLTIDAFRCGVLGPLCPERAPPRPEYAPRYRKTLPAAETCWLRIGAPSGSMVGAGRAKSDAHTAGTPRRRRLDRSVDMVAEDTAGEIGQATHRMLSRQRPQGADEPDPPLVVDLEDGGPVHRCAEFYER